MDVKQEKRSGIVFSPWCYGRKGEGLTQKCRKALCMEPVQAENTKGKMTNVDAQRSQKRDRSAQTTSLFEAPKKS